jgi:hypothetical protein
MKRNRYFLITAVALYAVFGLSDPVFGQHGGHKQAVQTPQSQQQYWPTPPSWGGWAAPGKYPRCPWSGGGIPFVPGGTAAPASPAPAEPEPAQAPVEQPQKEQPRQEQPQARPDPGVEAADRLTERDQPDRVREGAFAKVYTIGLKGGQSYVIDLESPGGGEWFDVYLRVEDGQGKVLAEDNDSGGRMNARLTLRPGQDGEYRLVVTSFRPKATGVFFLRVR